MPRDEKAGLIIAEVQEESPIEEPSYEEVKGVGEKAKVSVKAMGKKQVIMDEEEISDDREGRDRRLERLASGLAEASDEYQAKFLLAKARRVKDSQSEAARAGPLDAQLGVIDPAIEEAFAALMRSIPRSSERPSLDEFADLDLIDAAFDRHGAATDLHLPGVGNSALMELTRTYVSQVSYYPKVMFLF